MRNSLPHIFNFNDQINNCHKAGRLMFNDCLPKFITPKTSFRVGLFAVELMGQQKGNFFFMLFAGGCFNEVATRSKSYWKHCYLEATFSNWTKRQRITFDWEKSCIQPTVKTAHTLVSTSMDVSVLSSKEI